MSTIPDYSIIKSVPKVCHNALECVGKKCICLSSDGRFQIIKVNQGDSYRFYAWCNTIRKRRTDLSPDCTRSTLFHLPWGFLFSFSFFFFFLSNAIKRSPKDVSSYMRSCINHYWLVMLREPTAGPKWCYCNSRYFTPVTIPSMNIGPIILFNDMVHHTVILSWCNSEMTQRWDFSYPSGVSFAYWSNHSTENVSHHWMKSCVHQWNHFQISRTCGLRNLSAA